MENEVNRKLYALLEENKVFKNRESTPARLAKAIGISQKELEKTVFESTGITLSLVLELYRIQNARELLIQGFDYETVCTLSGFPSRGAMERAFEVIVG